MTRDETVELLRVRWRLTGHRFDNETADLWHEVLEDVDYHRARKAMIDLCTADKHAAFADFHKAVSPPRRPYDTGPASESFVMTDEQREINERGFAMVAEILEVEDRRNHPDTVDEIIRKWMPKAQHPSAWKAP